VSIMELSGHNFAHSLSFLLGIRFLSALIGFNVEELSYEPREMRYDIVIEKPAIDVFEFVGNGKK
jgi:hypothetical protein